MTYTKSSVEVADAIVSILDSQASVIGLKRVYYGDQDRIPEFPAACVEVAGKQREIRETQTFGITHDIQIMLYHGAVQTTELTTRERDLFVEVVENVLHENKQMNGTVIFGFVSRVTPGVALRQEIMLRSTQMLWTGLAKEAF